MNKYVSFLILTIFNAALIQWLFELDKSVTLPVSIIFSFFLWRQMRVFLSKRDKAWNKMTQEEKEEFASWYKTLTESEKDNFHKFTSEFPNKSDIQAKNELTDINGTFKYWKSKTYSLFDFIRLKKKTWFVLLIVILVPGVIYQCYINRDAIFGIMTEKQLSNGCACYENSKIHPDRMSPGEEKIRYKCIDIFYKISEARDQKMKEVMKAACESHVSESNTFNTKKIELLGNWADVNNIESTLNFNDNGIMYYDILNTNRLLSEFNLDDLELRYKIIEQKPNTILFKIFIYVEEKEVTSSSYKALFKDPNNVTISNIDYPQFEAITYRRQEK